MRDLLKKIILIALIIISVCTIYIYYPRTVDRNFQGLIYRLGTDNVGSEKQINIIVKGKMYRSLSLSKRFKGTIECEGYEIPIPKDYNLDIFFYKSNSGYIYYNIDQGLSLDITFGRIYINKDFSKFTIAVIEYTDESRRAGGWSGEDGLMITAPCTSRSEALDISNELMKDSLNGFVLN